MRVKRGKKQLFHVTLVIYPCVVGISSFTSVGWATKKDLCLLVYHILFYCLDPLTQCVYSLGEVPSRQLSSLVLLHSIYTAMGASYILATPKGGSSHCSTAALPHRVSPSRLLQPTLYLQNTPGKQQALVFYSSMAPISRKHVASLRTLSLCSTLVLWVSS